MSDKEEMRSKLERIHVLVVDNYLDALEAGKMHVSDMAPVITLLNHNKVVSKTEEQEGTHKKVKRLVRK